MKAVLPILMVLMLAACNKPAPNKPPDSEIFGQSYDECILKNANKGGDAGSRSMATEVCERHFIRTSTSAEDNNITVTSTLIHLPEPFDETKIIPNISFEIKNDNTDVVIKHIDITVEFKKDTGPSEFLTWTRNVSIDPGDSDSESGTFSNDKAPSEIIGATSSISRVLPRTGVGG